MLVVTVEYFEQNINKLYYIYYYKKEHFGNMFSMTKPGANEYQDLKLRNKKLGAGVLRQCDEQEAQDLLPAG